MTATPIPRSLALTVFGELDVTEIAKPPANRKPIVTAWVGAERSSEAYARLRVHLDAGRQAYVVCPLIEESETRIARAAEAEAERLQRAELAGYRVGLLHGRLKAAERREVMRAFKERELDVLVATTVIEVGVDVPNATIMIVQEADRFGLAQLHQLRGRVGRGRGAVLLPADLASEGRADRLRPGAPRGARRDERRLRARRARPRASRRGPAPRHAPVRPRRPPLHPPPRRPRPPRASPRARPRARRRPGPWHAEADALLSGADPSTPRPDRSLSTRPYDIVGRLRQLARALARADHRR